MPIPASYKRATTDFLSKRRQVLVAIEIGLAKRAESVELRWTTTTGTPKLSSTETVKAGESISAVLVFSGCAAGPGNVCKVLAEFHLLSPDGGKMPAGHGPVRSGAPPKAGVLMLGDASVTIGFDRGDAPGTYTLMANVTDQVARRSLQLSIPFSLAK